MLVPIDVIHCLSSGMKPLHVLHVGAHEAEEAEKYEALGADTVHWVESQPDLVRQLREKLDGRFHRIYQGSVWSESGQQKHFHLASNSQSSSLYPFHLHLKSHPEVTETGRHEVTTIRLDDLLPEMKFNIVVMDIQGAELEALKGMGQLLDAAKIAYLEVNKRKLYKGIPMIEELDSGLKGRGFRRLVTSWEKGKGWGDAVYVKQVSWLRRLRAVHKFQSISKSRAKQ